MRLASRRAERRYSGVQKVAVLGIAAALAVAALVPLAGHLGQVRPPFQLSWYVLAPLFGLAELAVVHFRFRRDAHSFSLSDIPLVLGLYFSTSAGLILAVVAGNFLALRLIRRQRGIKLWFNLVEFASQAVVADIVFNSIVGSASPVGWHGWLASFSATAAAFAVADALVTGAITLTGGKVSKAEIKSVVAFGLGAGAINTALALILVTILWVRPSSAWLAIAPMGILFVAYRAYTQQRDERARIEALYELTLALHAAPIIEDAVVVAAGGARDLFEAEAAFVLLFGESGGPVAYRTVAGASASAAMVPVIFDRSAGRWPEILAAEAMVVRGLTPGDLAGLDPEPFSEVMVVPLLSGERRTGVLVVADPLSDVNSFHDRDLKVLETLAGRLGVSLENGRLEDSLAEVTRLKERLEEMIRSKDQFIASVSHELRTPLTGIVGLAQEIRQNRELFGVEEMDEFLGHIYEQSTELSNIIEDLLIAARADIGTLVVKPSPVDVVAALEPVLATHARKFGSKEIDPTPRGSAPEALADSLRLRQIVRNLVTNAHRYGGQKVWTEIYETASRVVIAVVDDGEGVPEESIEEIFRPYGRASVGIANPSSVGLGLSVSLQLARLMGGDLGYKRIDGTTRFEVSLPKAPATAEARAG